MFQCRLFSFLFSGKFAKYYIKVIVTKKHSDFTRRVAPSWRIYKMKISSLFSWNLIIFLLTYRWLFIIAILALLLYCIRKKYFEILFPFFCNFVIIGVIVLFPTIFEYDGLTRLPLGINEYFQDQLISRWGLKTFMSNAHDIIQGKKEYIHWRADYIDSTWGGAYVGMIKYSKDPPRSIGDIVVLESPRGTFPFHSNDNPYSWTCWRSDFYFGANHELLMQILSLTEFKIITFASTIWMFLFALYIFYKAKLKKTTTTYLYLCLFSSVMIPILLLAIAISSVKLIYVSPEDAINFLRGKEQQRILSLWLDDSAQKGRQKKIFDKDRKIYDVFISNDNFFPVNYIRINISLFQYIFYGKQSEGIPRAKEMTIKKICDDIYYGYYDKYIEENNYTFGYIYSLIIVQFLVLFSIFYLLRKKIFFQKYTHILRRD